MTKPDWLAPAFQAIAIDDEGRSCRDIPESACREEAGNFFIHVGSLTLSKSADSLIDPKLVLSWLILAIGAPAVLVGLLVPIRESGALLPQLFTAGALRRLPQRKWAWSIGTLIQGLSAIAIAIIALTLDGELAGWLILVCLAVLALARSICSVCYKDVLGKTVDKSRRGRATGLAGSLSAVTAIAFATLLLSGWIDRFTIVVASIIVAGAALIAAGTLFTQLTEEHGATDGGKTAIIAAFKNLSYLKTDPQLRYFIMTRSLLTATALAPPFMIAATSREGEALETLGFLVMASAGAALVSSFIWGRFADASSRRVLIWSATIAAIALCLTAALSFAGSLDKSLWLPAVLFILMIAYQGVRLGRSTHLVDMAEADTRADYTAISNTIIGLVLIGGAAFSALAAVTSATMVLAVMSGMCAVAVPIAWQLDEVQT